MVTKDHSNTSFFCILTLWKYMSHQRSQDCLKSVIGVVRRNYLCHSSFQETIGHPKAFIHLTLPSCASALALSDIFKHGPAPDTESTCYHGVPQEISFTILATWSWLLLRNLSETLNDALQPALPNSTLCDAMLVT